MTQIKITQFGDYVFENVMDCTTNFMSIDDNYTEVPDADGAFDNQLTNPGRVTKGMVSATIMLTAGSPAIMRKKRDALLAMLGKGPRPLWYMPDETDGTIGPRWTRARVSKIQLDEKAEDVDVMQQVSISWSVALPRWFSRPVMNYLGESDLSGDTVLVDQPTYYLSLNASTNAGQLLTPARVKAIVKPKDTIQVTNLGNASTPVTVSFKPSRPWTLGEGIKYGDPGVFIGGFGSASVQNLTVERKNYLGETIDKFQWLNTLTVNEELMIDAKTGTVTKYKWPNFNTSGFGDFVVKSGVGFIMLDPGINTIKIDGIFSGPFGHLILDWDDAWF